MSVLTRIRPIQIGTSSTRDLWEAMLECERDIARLEGEYDACDWKSLRASILVEELSAYREQARKIETELARRAASFLGGVDLRTFADRIG